MKLLRVYFVGLLVVFFLLAGCAQLIAQPTPEPTDTPKGTDTPILTVTITPTEPTSTPYLTSTSLPPATHPGTAADLPTLTPVTTIPPLASFTLIPTGTITLTPTITPIPSNTRFVAPRVGGATWTLTPVGYGCTVVSSYPAWGQTFRPRADFLATWKVRNTGMNPWDPDDVVFSFIGGQRMHTRGRGEPVHISFKVYVNDYLNLQVRIVPPKEPGFYVATWGLRKTNKLEPFCSLEVVINVAK